MNPSNKFILIVTLVNLWTSYVILCIIPLCSTIFVIILGFIYSMILFSTYEWLDHKYIRHDHKDKCNGKFLYPNKMAYMIAELLYCIGSIGITWYMTYSKVVVICYVLNMFIFAALSIRITDIINNRIICIWIQSFTWFRYMLNHCKIHYVDNTCNLNLLFPLFDLQVGTFRLKII